MVKKQHPYLKIAAVASVIVMVALVAFAAYLYRRPLPALAAAPVAAKDQPGGTVSIPWPAYGQSAIGLAGRGLLATSGSQKPMPTASVAKLMTALAVLDKKPLAPGQAGPMLTVTANDVAIYNNYLAMDGSLVPVQAGEQISEYDALQALLLPSANNMADMLANWAFGSVDAYTQYANQFAKANNMKHSTFADASGFSPNTVSTADDLVQLGLLALKQPVIAEIAAKRTAQIPLGGTVGPIYNVNGLLGRDGINGLKTGNTDQAGGVFLVSAERQVGSQKATVLAAVMGGPDLTTAMRATLPLLDAAAANLQETTLVKTGQPFGTYSAAWDKTPVKAVANKTVSALLWKADSVATKVELKPFAGPQSTQSDAGTVTVTTGSHSYSVPLTLDGAIPAPGFGWRLNRS